MIKTIKANGIDFAYRIVGAGEQTLVFVHGHGCSSTHPTLYQAFLEGLASHFRIVALDLRCHGSSAQTPDGFNLDQLAADIVSIVGELQLTRPVYCGHSLGGVVGLLAQLRQPGVFSALALVNTGPATGPEGISPEVLEHARQSYGNPAAVRQIISGLFERSPTEAILDTMVGLSGAVSSDLQDEYMRHFISFDVMHQLGQIEVPVLLVNGARDRAVSVQTQHAMAMAMRYSKDVTFSDEGHLMPFEAPERAAREVANFFSEFAPKVEFRKLYL